MSIREYLTNKYALWLDFGTIYENALHGTCRRIENALEESPCKSRRNLNQLDHSMLTSYGCSIEHSERSVCFCHILEKMLTMKEPHKVLFVAPTGEGKTHLYMTYSRLKTSKYLHELDPQHARVIFRAKVRILDLKINFKKKYAQDLLCPFCRHDQETFEHVFSCNVGLWCNNSLRGMTLTSLSNEASIQSLRSIAQFLTKYLKYRSEML